AHPLSVRRVPSPLSHESVGGVRGQDCGASAVRAERHQAAAPLRVGRGRVRGRQAGARARAEFAARPRHAPEGRALGGDGTNGRAVGSQKVERSAIDDGRRTDGVPSRRGGAIEDMNVTPDDFMPGPPPAPIGHATVLRDEVIAALAPRADGVYVDATLGGGGHAEAILEAAPGATVVGVDQDLRAIEIAEGRLSRFGASVRFVHGRFSELAQHLSATGLTWVDGIVADLGVSSTQLDDPSRGMSFRNEGPLDMRMSDLSSETALELIERLDNDELADIIFHYGD